MPLEVFGKNMRIVAKFMPTYWYIYAVDAIVEVKELTFDATRNMLEGMGIQLLYAVAFMCIASVVVRRRRVNGADN